ncbi:MAG: SLC13 family permease [Methylocella sp.]
MSTASLGMYATIVVFVLTYAGVALGRAPGLRIDRAGMALVGASLMIALGTLSFDEALNAVDLDAIALLLGMMIIVSQLRVSGFFELATRFALRRAHSAPLLLAAIVIVTGFFSAFLVNDAICLVMAPLVIDVTRALRRNPVKHPTTANCRRERFHLLISHDRRSSSSPTRRRTNRFIARCLPLVASINSHFRRTVNAS